MRAARWTPMLGLSLTVVLVAGCGHSQPHASAPTVAATQTPLNSPGPCPSPSTALSAWPKGIPADLPKPPGAVIDSDQSTPGGLRTVRFTTPTSLRDGVLFLLDSMSKAGYRLGRGDAEAAEADAPFASAKWRGAFRLSAQQTCRTGWLLAIAPVKHAVTSPLLPPHPDGSTSPLPFG